MASAAESFATNNARLDRRQMKKFDSRVTTMVLELVNTYGVRWRMQKDGVHILLYPLNNAYEGRPHKVSAVRAANQTLDSMERWVTQAVTPALVETKAELLAAHFNDPSKVRKVKAEQRAAETAQEPTSEPAPAPVAPNAEKSAAGAAGWARVPQLVVPDYLADVPTPKDGWGKFSKSDAPWPSEEEYNTFPAGVDTTPPEGYVRALDIRRKIINWWVRKDGGHYICLWRDFETDTLHHSAAHQRKHRSDKAELARQAGNLAQTKRRHDEAKTALQVIADRLGVEMSDDSTTAKLDAKVTELTGELNKTRDLLDKVTIERDEIKAKLDIVREGLSL